MSDNLSALQRHRSRVSLRTTGSIALYVGFIAASVLSAVQLRPLEDLVTLSSIGLIVLAFLALPRDYVPAVMLKRASTEAEENEIYALRRFERYGMYIRFTYIVGAVVTILILPAMAKPG